MREKLLKRLCTSAFFNEEGGALAEIAILVPVLVVMLAAVAEFGRFFQTYTTMAKATRSAARYLSNHPYNDDEIAKAKSLVVCGKLSCGEDDQPLVSGLTAAHVCVESAEVNSEELGLTGTKIIKISIPRVLEEVEDGEPCGAPYPYQPIFNIGALLHNSFSLEMPISTSTTMYDMLQNS